MQVIGERNNAMMQKKINIILPTVLGEFTFIYQQQERSTSYKVIHFQNSKINEQTIVPGFPIVQGSKLTVKA